MTHDRLAAVSQVLEDQHVDAILVTNGTNRRYLTGFTGEDHAVDEPAGQVVVSRDGVWLLAPSVNLPWARSEAVEGTRFIEWTSGQWPADVARLIVEEGWRTVGIEEGTITLASYDALTEALGDTDVRLVRIGQAVDAIRACKSDEELSLLRTALDMTDRAFIAAEQRMQAGMTEIEIAEIVREELRRVGSEGESFPTIVASGPNAAKPHHNPSDRRVQEGEPIIIDMGALHAGYAGDLTRTVWFGEPSEQLVTIYRLVKDAFDAAESAAGPGISGVDFDAAARNVFAAQNQDQYFTHSLGHGLGLRVHESPSASRRSKDTLAPGHVVTIEPGLYIPDWGGVRIEDVVAITEDGAENLTRAPKREL